MLGDNRATRKPDSHSEVLPCHSQLADFSNSLGDYSSWHRVLETL